MSQKASVVQIWPFASLVLTKKKQAHSTIWNASTTRPASTRPSDTSSQSTSSEELEPPKISLSRCPPNWQQPKTHDQLRSHMEGFVGACNFTKRLKILKGLRPYEVIRKARTTEPETFYLRSAPSNAGAKPDQDPTDLSDFIEIIKGCLSSGWSYTSALV